MQDYLPLITGGGGALVVLSLWVWAFFTGKIHSDREFSKLEQENTELSAAYAKLVEAIQIERKAVNETAAAGQVTNKLIAVLADIASEKIGRRPRSRTTAHSQQISAEDLGL